MCIFHTWSEWVQYEKRFQWTPGIIAPKQVKGKTFDGVEYRQYKKCIKCKKVKDVLVYEG